MTIRYHHFAAFPLLVLIAFVAGCGGSSLKTYRVEGTVTHNGSPVEGASVTFTPADTSGSTAGGRTDAAGKYTLMTSFGANGAEPGTYTVTISKREGVPTGRKILSSEGPDGAEVEVDEKVLRDMLPVQYGSAQTSPFKDIKVEAKSLNTFDFALD